MKENTVTKEFFPRNTMRQLSNNITLINFLESISVKKDDPTNLISMNGGRYYVF